MFKVKIIIAVSALFYINSVCGQTGNLPVADTDGLWSAKVNPAALSFGNASGLGYSINFNDDKFLKQYSLIANFKYLGYVFDRYEGVSHHRVNLSINPFLNFYLGGSVDWDNETGNTGLSALYRPWDFLSIASVNVFNSDNSDLDVYRQGVAIRPLAFKEDLGYRLALTVDTYYTILDNQKKEFAKPILGLQAEPWDGIRFGLAYNSETENIMANIGLALDGKNLSGTLTNWNQDNEFSTGSEYVFFSAEDFKAIQWKFGRKSWYELKLNKTVVDKNSSVRIGPFLINTGNTIELADLVQKLKDICNDKNIDGVLVKADGFATNFANYLELETAFKNLKAAGKKLVFYYTHIGNMNYAFAASVADQIYLNPNGGVYVAGVGIMRPYIKELLDTLGVEVVNFRSHKYKTAGNMFSEKGMTDAEREVYDALLTEMMTEYKRMITDGRSNKISQDLNVLIDNGPYLTPDEAIDLKLVDKLVYEEDLQDALQETDGKVAIVNTYYHSRRRYDWADEPSKNIAVIFAQGDIHEGTSNPGESIGGTTFARAIKAAREDKNIDGIILRVNSGGGSAVASDMISHEIEKCTERENKKPVVVSFGNIAASGGYYISSKADYILAQPISITGSIGVVGLVFNAEKLLEKIHINMEVLKKGRHADLGNWTRSMTEEEKEKIRKLIDWYYDRFTKIVADGRNMDIDAVYEVAQGRVWAGKKALEIGLVDELGGMNESYAWMKKELNTGKLLLKEFDGQDKLVAIEINAEIPGVTTDVPFIPENLAEQYERFRKLYQDSNEVVYFLAPFMMNQVMK